MYVKSARTSAKRDVRKFITDILRISHFEMSQEKLRNIHYFKSYSEFRKALKVGFFGNIFVNNRQNFVNFRVILRKKFIAM